MDRMSLFPDGVLVIWKWEFGDSVESDSEREDADDEGSEDHGDESTAGTEDVPSHTVTFNKCVGTTREDRYQQALQLIANYKPV